eukprot:3049118-Pyramimonas_sp.AAC.1
MSRSGLPAPGVTLPSLRRPPEPDPTPSAHQSASQPVSRSAGQPVSQHKAVQFVRLYAASQERAPESHTAESIFWSAKSYRKVWETLNGINSFAGGGFPLAGGRFELAG